MTIGIWDDQHLKAVLRLPRYPMALIEQEPWHGWIESQGGLRSVHGILGECPLPPHEAEFLRLLLRHPGASVQSYCERMSISRRTYANYLNSLCATLVLHLNNLPLTPAVIAEHRVGRWNVPAPLMPLIGANDALAAVVDLLRKSGARCITLTGPGGVGKTRLAIEVANEVSSDFVDGVVFFALDTISDPALLGATIIRVLDLQLKGTEQPLEGLKTYLRSRRLLFVLDNLEHLPGAGSLVTELLQSAPGLKILSTSRGILDVYGEYCFALEPLPVPDSQTALTTPGLAEVPAVQLFVERARAVRQSFALTTENAATIAQICRMLDGLPLAIELAAARIRTHTAEELLAQLRAHLVLLRSPQQNRPARHQGLWEVMDWSYRLLDPQQKALFRRLAIFDHGWDLGAAQMVCEYPEIQPYLDALVEKSLVQRRISGTETRFSMLNTLREYALEQLRATGEAESVGRRHAWYYLTQVETAEVALGKSNFVIWASWLQKEHGNLQTALSWMLERDQASMALRLVGAVWRYWQIEGMLTEGRYWLLRVLKANEQTADVLRLKGLWGAGWLAVEQGDISAATAYFEDGVDLARQLDEPRWIALLQSGLGEVRRAQQRYQEAWRLFQNSLAIFELLDDWEEIAWSFDQLSRLALEERDFAHAQQCAETSLAAFRKLQHHWGMSHALGHLGDTMWNQGQLDLAATLFGEALQESEVLRSHWLAAWTLCKLSMVRLEQGEIPEARATLRESLRLHTEAENTLGMVTSLACVAMLVAEQGALNDALQLCVAVQSLHRDLNLPPLGPMFAQGIAQVLAKTRAELAPNTFTEAWKVGQTLTMTTALTHARKWLL